MFRRFFSLTKPLQNLVSLVFYIIFFIYMIKMIITETSATGRLLYIVITVGLGGVAAWYELMNYLLYNGTRQVIQRCNLEKAKARLDFLDKIDFFKNLAGSSSILRLMILRDSAEYEKMAELAEARAKDVMADNPDFKLVSRHSRFIAYGELGNLELCNQFYHSLYEIRFIKVKNKVKQISPYYSWDEIDAAYHYYNGKFTAGLRSIKKVPVQNMNNRERMQYHYLYARLLYRDGSLKKALEQMDKAIEYTCQNISMKVLLEEEKKAWCE